MRPAHSRTRTILSATLKTVISATSAESATATLNPLVCSDLPVLLPPRHIRCSVRRLAHGEGERMNITRTVGAAIGLIAVLLFFASLTIEQNRAVSLISRPTTTANR